MEKTIAHYFLENCRRFPQQTAIVVPKDKSYTYEELFQQVHLIYQHLVAQNITDTRIGIYCTNDVWTVAAILAVSAYGAAYVPINPKFPTSRNAFIVADCNLRCVLSSEPTIFFGENISLICLSQLNNTEQVAPYYLNPQLAVDVAYILYTSGSTGVPKGVPVKGESVAMLFDFLLQNYHFSEKDTFLQCFEWTFDMSVLCLFGAFLKGSCCYLMEESSIKWVQILQYIQQYKISVLALVPSVIALSQKYLPQLVFSHVRYCFFSGEALLHSHTAVWAKTVPLAQIVNMYGLTESAIVISYYNFEENISAKESVNDIVPIGHFFPETTILLVNEKGDEVNSGEIGELCLAGKQLIVAYINQVHEERFFYYQKNAQTLLFYRSGDLVKRNKWGNYLYIGRNDEQVQIQGYRVELKEIEEVLSKIAHCRAAVVAKEDENKNAYLVAFVEKPTLDLTSIAQKMQELVSFYMLPKKIIILNELPLSLNGKIDKKTLKTMV
ncbi:MAG: AMP-binding protein [Chitinophagales bacterium]|nr:AMP-binding protein [Bacteroidota bacterium]MCB9042775.1 AMP-binding protein [Chitinophagales bacterium]